MILQTYTDLYKYFYVNKKGKSIYTKNETEEYAFWV